MKINDLHIVLQEGENECIEFKTSFSKAVIESIVAFSNSKGGKIFLGISEKKEIAGININDESIQTWINEIKQNTSPQIIPEVQLLDVEN